MWINNSKVEKLIKNDQEIPEGFQKGRLAKVKKIDILKEQVSKEELIQYYIIENHSYIETMQYFNLSKRKDLRLLLTEYQIAKSPKQSAKYAKRARTHESYLKGGQKSSQTQKDKWVAKSEIEKLAWSSKQKEAHSSDSFRNKISQINKDYNKNLDEDIKQKRNLKRSKSCKDTWSNPELIKRQKETARSNRKVRNILCRTQQEQNIYDVLLAIYPDTQYDQFVDDRYPYYVDFYIPSLDLFIEYQGFPAHGKYPYIEGDVKSINEVNRLYGGWRDQYLNLDPKKYNKALESKINFIRIYPQSTLQQNLNFNNNQFKDIIELIYNSYRK